MVRAQIAIGPRRISGGARWLKEQEAPAGPRAVTPELEPQFVVNVIGI